MVRSRRFDSYRMALGGDILVPALIFGGIGLFLLGAGLREGYLALRLWRVRPVPIADLDDATGTVTVAGTAERIDAAVRAPLTGTECLGYTWRVLGVQTARRFDGHIEQSFHQLGRGRDAVRFRLADYTGSVVVDPAGATLRLSEEQVTDPVGDPVDRGGIPAPDIVQEGPRQYYEARIDDGETVVVQKGPRQYYEARIDDGETVVVQGRVRPAEDSCLDVEKLGVQVSGRGTYIADADHGRVMRRSAAAAAVVSVLLGLAALAGILVLLGAISF